MVRSISLHQCFLWLLFGAIFTEFVSGRSLMEKSMEWTVNIPPSELAALQELYNYTSGDQWRWRMEPGAGSRWIFSTGCNPCSERWQGLTCEVDDFNTTANIIEVNLELYGLKGTLPSGLAQLRNLTTLVLSTGLLTGTIPDSFGTWSDLTELDLSLNRLSGTLPASFVGLTNLRWLYLQYNVLHGTFPASWLQLSELRGIYLGDNKLTGTLPANINQLTYLEEIDVDTNSLSGPIPSTLFSLSGLTDISFNENAFSGTIAAALSNMKHLTQLSLNDNLFSGSIPEVANFTNVYYFTVDGNQLTGPLSTAFGALTRMGHFGVSDNYLTGTLPNNLESWHNIVGFRANGNFLTGTIPAPYGEWKTLNFLWLEQNLLTGTLPTFVEAVNLHALGCNDNMLSGTLDGLFAPAQQPLLNTIILGDNGFTGTIPADLFASDSLLVFVANTNCFHGSISEEICAATHLSSLVLDGLSSAKACRTLRFAGSYSISGKIEGSIPTCLFQLPNMTCLHLSGNGLTGSLPQDVDIAVALYDLTLSHNRLTGSIPPQIQQRKFLTLDLSYNRLSGTLKSDFGGPPSNTSYWTALEDDSRHRFVDRFNQSAPELLGNLTLPVALVPQLLLASNRLSGRIPGSLSSLPDVSILGTNLFSCRLDGSDLPPADNGDGNYQCGSNAFDVPYYVWLSLSALLAAAATVILRRYPAIVQPYLASAAAPIEVAQLLQLVQNVQHLSVSIAVVIIVALLPLYCILSAFYGEYTYEYAWSVSAGFLFGEVPMALMMTAWMLLLCALVAAVTVTVRTAPCGETIGKQASVSRSASASSVASVARWTPDGTILLYAAYALLNLIVVVGVNTAYVYIAVYQSAGLLTFAQILLSFFKLSWSTLCTSKSLRNYTANITSRSRTLRSESHFASLQIFVALVNNIVVPCVVVAVISPSCFYNAFVAAPTVVSDYIYPVCAFVGSDNQCTQYEPTKSTTYYDPPFIYNYQCSSSMITYYAPAFVNMCIISTFLTPVAQAGMVWLHRRSAPGSCWQALLRSCAPQILLAVDDMTASVGAVSVTANKRGVFNSNRLIVALASYVGILLTFGVVFPPLAVALVLAVSCICLLETVKINLFLRTAAQYKCEWAVQALSEACRAVGSLPVLARNAMWIVVTVSCWFYTLFLFDTLGDAVGFQGAYWVLIVMPLMPVVLYLLSTRLESKDLNQALSGATDPSAVSAVESGVDVEMSAVMNPVVGKDGADA